MFLHEISASHLSTDDLYSTCDETGTIVLTWWMSFPRSPRGLCNSGIIFAQPSAECTRKTLPSGSFSLVWQLKTSPEFRSSAPSLKKLPGFVTETKFAAITSEASTRAAAAVFERPEPDGHRPPADADAAREQVRQKGPLRLEAAHQVQVAREARSAWRYWHMSARAIGKRRL